MQFLSQSKIDKRNLKLIPDVGNIIPYRQLETFLFGGHVPELNRMLLLHRGFVLEDENNDLFFKLSKMEKFLEFSFDNIDFTKNTICPINYLSLVKFDKNLTLTTKMDRLINIMLDFKIFLNLMLVIFGFSFISVVLNSISGFSVVLDIIPVVCSEKTFYQGHRCPLAGKNVPWPPR